MFRSLVKASCRGIHLQCAAEVERKPIISLAQYKLLLRQTTHHIQYTLKYKKRNFDNVPDTITSIKYQV